MASIIMHLWHLTGHSRSCLSYANSSSWSWGPFQFVYLCVLMLRQLRLLDKDDDHQYFTWTSSSVIMLPSEFLGSLLSNVCFICKWLPEAFLVPTIMSLRDWWSLYSLDSQTFLNVWCAADNLLDPPKLPILHIAMSYPYYNNLFFKCSATLGLE